MQAEDFTRLAHMSVVCSDLILRHRTSTFRGDDAKPELPLLPNLVFDRVPASHASLDYVAGVREYLTGWRREIARLEDITKASAPAISSEEQAEVEHARGKLRSIEDGKDAFVEAHANVDAARVLFQTTSTQLKEATTIHSKRVRELEAELNTTRARSEEFRNIPPAVMATEAHLTSEIRDLQRQLAVSKENHGAAVEVEFGLKKPILFGRARFQRRVEASRATQVELQKMMNEAQEALEAGLRDAHASALAVLDNASETSSKRLDAGRNPPPELLSARDAAREAEESAASTRAEAAQEFEALSNEEPTLRAQVQTFEAAAEAQRLHQAEHAEAMKVIREQLGIAFAGLNAGGAALASEEAAQGGTKMTAAAEALASSKLASLFTDADFVDMREVWCERCPDLFDECFVALGSVAHAWTSDGPEPKADRREIVGPLLELIALQGFVPNVARSPGFFVTAKDLLALEFFHTRDERTFVASIAALLCGDSWCRDHRPDFVGKLRALAIDLLEQMTGSSIHQNPALRQLLSNAEEMAADCLSGHLGLGAKDHRVPDWSRVIAVIREASRPAKAMEALRRERLDEAYRDRLMAVDSFEAARNLLGECGFNLKGKGGERCSIVVKYLKPGRAKANEGEIATVELKESNWQLIIQTPVYFYGDGDGQFLVTCGAYADWIDYVIMHLATHQQSDGVVVVSQG